MDIHRLIWILENDCLIGVNFGTRGYTAHLYHIVTWQWYSELGVQPPGNTEPVQKALWEQPGDAGSISERGRSAAASSKAKAALQLMTERGLREEVLRVGNFVCLRT